MACSSCQKAAKRYAVPTPQGSRLSAPTQNNKPQRQGLLSKPTAGIRSLLNKPVKR